MNLQNSHIPYEVPADFADPFGSGRPSFPIRFGSFPEDSVTAVKDLYANALAYVDVQLGRLVQALEAQGILQNTVIVISGDTGQGFFEHGFSGHANALYDELMRVPLVIRAPGLEPGVQLAPSEHVDVPPTLLRLLGLPPHPSFQGVSLIPSRPDKPLFLVAQALVNQAGIVHGEWKLIFDSDQGSYQLFNLREDPEERVNLSRTHPDILREMATQLHSWRKSQMAYYTDPVALRMRYPPR